jgi:hypothetical protein
MSRKPCIQDNGDGTQKIDLGWIVQTVLALGIASFLGAIIGIPLLAATVSANDEEIAIIKKAQVISARNQVVLDEQVRGLKADSSWTQDKLNALLKAAGVTEHIKRPDVEDSKLEHVE